MKNTVLIVEDAESTCKALNTMLTLNNYQVVGMAADGVQAVELYKRLKPDLVLMDIAMPKKHGIDAIREIRDFDPEARFIAVTALYSAKKKKEALDAGASMVVVKPFDVADLINAMESVLE
ncbi:MAG: response regulator [Candidatus Thermoplasmatota archaeon]|jgi:two-component system chemotaxis response regulator CheY|nr:response regulator [Candidatus Thermoplasmatota archaeon]